MYRDTTLLASTTFQWTPNTWAMDGEIHRRGDEMPGEPSTHEVFKDTYRKLGSGSWAGIATIANYFANDNNRFDSWEDVVRK
jgi:hypothetical protein